MLDIILIYYFLGTLTYVFLIERCTRLIAKKGDSYQPSALLWWGDFILHILIWPVSIIIVPAVCSQKMSSLNRKLDTRDLHLNLAVSLLEDWVLTDDHADFCPIGRNPSSDEDCTCMDRSHFNHKKNAEKTQVFLNEIHRSDK